MILAIQSYPGANPALERHYPYFKRLEANHIYVIGTETGHNWCPPDAELVICGPDRYMDGPHLPKRLIGTFEWLLHLQPQEEWLCVCEYDTLIFNRIRMEAMELAAAAHMAGHHEDYHFWHNPWILHREVAQKFIGEGTRVIEEGKCTYGSAESSPDVFFGLIMHRLGIAVNTLLWTEFSRNSLDCAGDLDRARDAFRSGIDVLHGVKTQQELEYITT